MTNLRRRVLALEERRSLTFPQRVVVRYGGEEPEQPEGEIDENTLVVHVEYVDAPLPSAATEKAR
jgi:hypothetical protein